MTTINDSLKNFIKTHKQWLVLSSVGLALLLVALDNSILYTALPILTQELGANQNQALWIINAYPLVLAGLLLGTGTLGDRIGHKKLFLGGVSAFGIASLIAAFSPNPETLIASRVLLAIGAAFMMPSTLSLIRLTFTDKRELNIAIAIWGTLATIGAALGPIVGGLLLQWFWWGSVFLLNVPFVILAIIGATLFAPAGRANSAKPWDLISSLQFLMGLTGVILIIKEVAKNTPSTSVILFASLLAVVGLALFMTRQKRLPYPLLDLKIFKQPALASGVIGAMVSMFAIAGVQLIVTQRFQLVADFTPLQAGFVAASVATGALITGMLGGMFLHKLGLRVIISSGFATATLGALLLVYALPSTLLTVIGLALIGLGLGFVMAVASTAIVGNVSKKEAGMASAVNEVSYELGSLVAVAVIGSLIASVYSSSVHLPSNVPQAARESISETHLIAHDLENREDILRAAGKAYDHGFSTVAALLVGVLGMSAVITFALLREYGPGSNAGAHY